MGKFNNNDNYAIILGKTSTGKNITLYKCFEKSIKFSMNGFYTTVVTANTIFQGAHFKNKEDITFKEISCRFFNLDEWAWRDGIDIEELPNDEINIKYKHPPKKSVDINEEYSVEIHSRTQYPRHSIVQKEANITQEIYMKILNKKSNSFRKLLDQVYHLRNFISLGVGKPVSIKNVFGKTEINKKKREGDFYYPEVKIYYNRSKSLIEKEKILPQYMLFNLREIQNEFANILKNWFDTKKILSPVINLYFGTLYNSEMYIEQTFLSLVQALESYHRRTKKNNEIDPSDHKKRVNSILNDVDNQYEKWLERKLSYTNEPTLKKRLQEMVDECEELLNFSSKKKSFIYKVYDTRNYLTHYDSSLSHRAVKGKDLIDIINKLKIIIEFNLLVEIGFDNKMAFQLLKKKHRL